MRMIRVFYYGTQGTVALCQAKRLYAMSLFCYFALDDLYYEKCIRTFLFFSDHINLMALMIPPIHWLCLQCHSY